MTSIQSTAMERAIAAVEKIHPTDPAKAFRTMWARTTGDQVYPSHAAVDTYLRYGWTHEATWVVADLADHIRDRAEGGYREWLYLAGRTDALVTRPGLAEFLSHQMVAMMQDGLTLDEALTWMTVFATAPVGEGSRMHDMLYLEPRVSPHATVQWSRTFEDIAPLAWAAGLSTHDALERQRTGTMDPEPLEMLAVLRGYEDLPCSG